MLGFVAVWAAVAFGLAIMWIRYGAATATTLLTVLSGTAALTQTIVKWPGRRRVASSREQLDRAAEALAWEVRTQWEAEASRRQLVDTDWLPVRWRSECGQASHASGDLDELISSYVSNPRRMVVLGAPGSGKTGFCVSLTLELLDRTAGARVPVLLQISTWNPADNLHGWLIRTILQDYPFLADEERYGASAVRDMLTQHRILPVLDGLDEIAEDQRAAALSAIERDARGAEALVLTSRSREFEAASLAGVLRNAEIARLLPVEAKAAADYLREGARGAEADRWEPVLSVLAGGGDAPLVLALQTPLMLFLARAAYADTGSDPAELLGLHDVRRIEEHLLDAFTRGVFARRPPSPLATVARPVRDWDPVQAERWLAFLARNCGREIAWWRLYRLMPQRVRVIMGVLFGGLACVPLGVLMFALFGRPEFGAELGLAVGASGGAALSFVPPEAPRRFVPRPLRGYELARDLVFGAIGALVGGIVVGVLWGPGYGVAIGLVFGLAFGLVHRFTRPTEPREAVTPAGLLRGDRVAVLYAAALGGVTGTLVGAVMGGIVGGTATRGLVIHITNPILVGLLGAAVGALLGACGLGLVAQSPSASGVFSVAEIWLALRGATPLRLMTFLEDAHQLGVLRQAGPYYQFRHAALQDRLALRR